MLLIQIGDLGLAFIGVFYIQGKQKLSLHSRETIQESFSYRGDSVAEDLYALHLFDDTGGGQGAFLRFRFIP